MQLSPKTRLGSYEILASLGAGGMGEVYRARDLRLQRDVAIKILPAAFVDDTERVSRFQREAQILASLNHSNIAVIHDVQEVAGTHFLVLELVEGETLARRLNRGRLAVDEALEVCRQVAEALEAAHGKDMLHRDLKPANIQLTPDGRVKVLDFGLAKMMQPEEPLAGSSNSPTVLSAGQTGQGVILGTAAYMSPEQARGRALDKGTDIWAFGCVLFEALTASPAFNGEDVPEILAGIMKSEPDWGRLPADTPHVVRSLLRQCLQKQSKHRLHSAGAAKIMLEDAIKEPSIAEVSASVPQTSRTGWKRMLPLVAASMLAGAFGVWALRPPPLVDRGVTRLLLDVKPAARFNVSTASVRPSRVAVAVSPDGRTVVFSGMRGTTIQLFRRALDAAEAVPMPGTEGARGPFFSPNGQWIGFWSANKLRKAPLEGGPPVEICDVAADPAGLFGASWGSDDMIVFSAEGAGISRVQAGGGTPSEVTKGDAGKSEGRHILPHLLPGGKVMLYTAAATLTDWEQTSIVAESLETHQRQTLIRGGADARYVSTGHLLYMKSGTLMAVAFDAERLELEGSPVAVLDNVMQAVNPPWNADETGSGQFDVAANGTLVYLSGGIHPTFQRDLVWVDRKGEFSRLAVNPGPYFAPRVSPDAKRVVFHAQRERSREYLIWSYDINRQTATRLALEGDNCCPVWSPNGDSLVFRSVESGIFHAVRILADGTRAPERLTTSQFAQVPTSWSPLNIVAFTEIHDSTSQIWTIPLDGDRARKLLMQTSFPLNHPAFSPDGRWIAYSSTEAGVQDVYVQAFPGPGEKIRISVDGGSSPAWAANGRELFYQKRVDPGGRMMAVDIDTRKEFQAGKPHVLFEGPYSVNSPMRGYDVTPDGERFVMTRPSSEAATLSSSAAEEPFTQMHIVLNWTEELKRRVPTR